jgi:hypothetical protein
MTENMGFPLLFALDRNWSDILALRLKRARVPYDSYSRRSLASMTRSPRAYAVFAIGSDYAVFAIGSDCDAGKCQERKIARVRKPGAAVTEESRLLGDYVGEAAIVIGIPSALPERKNQCLVIDVSD